MLVPAIAAAMLPAALLAVTPGGRLNRPAGALLIISYAGWVTAALARRLTRAAGRPGCQPVSHRPRRSPRLLGPRRRPPRPRRLDWPATSPAPPQRHARQHRAGRIALTLVTRPPALSTGLSSAWPIRALPEATKPAATIAARALTGVAATGLGPAAAVARSHAR